MVTISVVIPVKDDADMLSRCLVALDRQTRRADEIIVVDNGSSDHSVATALAHGVRVLSELRPGITAAASCGYDAVHSTVIARCDADSIAHPEWLREIDTAFEQNPTLAAATAGARFYDLTWIGDRLARALYLGGYFAAAGAAVANIPLFGSNFALRTAVWRRVSASVPRDLPDLHDDFDLSYRIGPQEHVRYHRAMRMSISGRPFASARSFLLRFRRAWATIALHSPGQLPPLRWFRKIAAASPPLRTSSILVADTAARLSKLLSRGVNH